MNDIEALNPPQDALPLSSEQLLTRLKELGIDSTTLEHEAVYTVEEAQKLDRALPGAHIKNLFLRNKKEEMWLVVAEQNKRVDLKKLGDTLGAGKLSFGSPSHLMTYLGVLPGAVTPFSVVNDRKKEVRLVLDRDLKGCDRINAHPLVNTKTTNISFADLLRFLEAEGHPPLYCALD